MDVCFTCSACSRYKSEIKCTALTVLFISILEMNLLRSVWMCFSFRMERHKLSLHHSVLGQCVSWWLWSQPTKVKRAACLSLRQFPVKQMSTRPGRHLVHNTARNDNINYGRARKTEGAERSNNYSSLHPARLWGCLRFPSLARSCQHPQSSPGHYTTLSIRAFSPPLSSLGVWASIHSCRMVHVFSILSLWATCSH